MVQLEDLNFLTEFKFEEKYEHWAPSLFAFRPVTNNTDLPMWHSYLNMAGDCSQYEFHKIKYCLYIIILTHSIIHASRTDITAFQCISACTAV
jgi:hypothetical protein